MGAFKVSEEWYVLRSKPHKEFLLFNQLAARNIECYFPRLKAHPVNPRAAKVKAFFPSYMFVNCDLDEVGMNAFKWMPYSQGLVCFDGIPAIVPDNIVIGLEKRIGHIYQGEESSKNGMKSGSAVVITNGPFTGYEGIFDSRLDDKERVKVLLNLVDNKRIQLKMDIGHLQPLKN